MRTFTKFKFNFNVKPLYKTATTKHRESSKDSANVVIKVIHPSRVF